MGECCGVLLSREHVMCRKRNDAEPSRALQVIKRPRRVSSESPTHLSVEKKSLLDARMKAWERSVSTSVAALDKLRADGLTVNGRQSVSQTVSLPPNQPSKLTRTAGGPPGCRVRRAEGPRARAAQATRGRCPRGCCVWWLVLVVWWWW